MAQGNSGMSCTSGCWWLAIGIGVVSIIVMLTMGNYGLFGAALLSAVIVIILGFLFTYLFCREAASAPAAAQPAPQRQAAPADADTPPQAEPVAEPAPVAAASDKASEDAPAADTSATSAVVKSGTLLAGEEELNSRKGTWKYDASPAAAPAAAPTKASAAKPGTEAATPAAAQPEGLSAAREGHHCSQPG